MSDEKWQPGDIVWFHCLHEDTVWKERELRGGYILYSVEGKPRPCLIFRHDKKYYRVWRLTSQSKGGRCIKYKDDDTECSYLREKYPNEDCWTHEKLSVSGKGRLGQIHPKSLEGLPIDQPLKDEIRKNIEAELGYRPRV